MTMYEKYYGLNSKPFQLNPDPEFYFGSKQHKRAKAYLDYGVERSEGFIVITGEVGAGKTTLVRGLLGSLNPEKVVAASLVTTQLNAEDTLRMVGAAFGVRVKDVSKADLLMGIEAYLLSQTSQGKRCLLVVDEAQNLTEQAVEELRMLSNFQFGKQALLQTFLVGQPEFRTILQSPTMQQLRQRVTATCHIGPLDASDTQAYIDHRLKCSGASGRPTFEEGSIDAVFNAAEGIPRRINFICDRLLLHGFLANKDIFSKEDVNQIVNEIQNETSAPIKKINRMHQGEEASLEDDQNEKNQIDLSGQNPPVSKAMASSISSQIERLAGEQSDARLRRLEGSVLRLERINLEVLGLLKKLVFSLSETEQENEV